MPPRKYSKSDADLSGGLRDNNPQFFSAGLTIPAVASSGTGRTTVAAFQLPLPVQFNAPANMAVVFEILKVTLDTPTPLGTFPTSNPSPGTFVINNITSELRSGNLPPTPVIGTLVDQSVIVHSHDAAVYATDSVSGDVRPALGPWSRLKIFDLTDEAGHGLVLPTQNVWFIVSETSGGTANITSQYLATTAAFRLLFRYKAIPLSEYIQATASML